MVRAKASPIRGFVESPGLSLGVDQFGGKQGGEYLSEIFSARGPD